LTQENRAPSTTWPFVIAVLDEMYGRATLPQKEQVRANICQKPTSLRQESCQRWWLFNGRLGRWLLKVFIVGHVGCWRKTPLQKPP